MSQAELAAPTNHRDGILRELLIAAMELLDEPQILSVGKEELRGQIARVAAHRAEHEAIGEGEDVIALLLFTAPPPRGEALPRQR